MRAEYGDTTAKVWLFLLQQGGRWTAGDVAKHVAVECPMSQALAAMHATGNVQRFQVPGKAPRFVYGVTSDCRIPRSVRVRDVADCLTAQPDVGAA